MRARDLALDGSEAGLISSFLRYSQCVIAAPLEILRSAIMNCVTCVSRVFRDAFYVGACSTSGYLVCRVVVTDIAGDCVSGFSANSRVVLFGDGGATIVVELIDTDNT